MLKWPPPSKDKTTIESKRLFSPPPDDLRALVYDYLCHNSFTEAARAFVNDTTVKHLDEDGDDIMCPENAGGRDVLAETLDERLRQAELRKEVKIHVLSGRVEEAIELIHTHFPAVLPQESSLAPISLPSDPPPSSSHDSHDLSLHSTVDPTHLLLNLRILGFIEAARTVPLPYHPPGAPPPASPLRAPSPLKKSEVRGEEDDPELSEQQLVLLHKAQKLYSEANCLPRAEDRALYLKELAQVSALLAYPNPENSIMAPWLAQDRREAVADQIERAIFHSLRQSTISHIELCTRYTTAMWSLLNEQKTKLPPRTKWPPGVVPPGGTTVLTNHDDTPTSGEKASPGKKASEKELEILPFSLADFLNAKA